MTTKPDKFMSVFGKEIEGVIITPQKRISDERGRVMHMMKSTDPTFTKFGEIYFSCAFPGVVKAWHVHSRMTLNNCVLKGMAKLVCYDIRENSPTHGNLMEIHLGEYNYVTVQIPPGVANGYKAYGDEMAILANCPDMPHDPTEISYIDPMKNEIPYDWELRHG